MRLDLASTGKRPRPGTVPITELLGRPGRLMIEPKSDAADRADGRQCSVLISTSSPYWEAAIAMAMSIIGLIGAISLWSRASKDGLGPAVFVTIWAVSLILMLSKRWVDHGRAMSRALAELEKSGRIAASQWLPFRRGARAI